jgi:hypothetical protein
MASVTDPAGRWDARLWRLWVPYSALAYTVILGFVLGLDFIRVAVRNRAVGTLSLSCRWDRR